MNEGSAFNRKDKVSKYSIDDKRWLEWEGNLSKGKAGKTGELMRSYVDCF